MILPLCIEGAAIIALESSQALSPVGSATEHGEGSQLNHSGPKITLVLPYPISSNRYWATRVIPKTAKRKAMAITYVTNEAETYKRECGWLARRAGVTTLTGRVSLTIDLYPNRPQDWAKRARKDPDTWADSVQCIDLGNCEKVLSDALNGIAWNDDKQLHDIRLRRMEPDDKGARVEVTITPIVAVKIAPELGL